MIRTISPVSHKSLILGTFLAEGPVCVHAYTSHTTGLMYTFCVCVSVVVCVFLETVEKKCSGF